MSAYGVGMKQTSSPRIPVGANVRAELARRGLPAADLAAELGVSCASVSRRLAGRTPFSADELVATASWLGVPLTDLCEPVQLLSRGPQP
jgi:transcriptional regulator with XRE-family HTH domain